MKITMTIEAESAADLRSGLMTLLGDQPTVLVGQWGAGAARADTMVQALVGSNDAKAVAALVDKAEMLASDAADAAEHQGLPTPTVEDLKNGTAPKRERGKPDPASGRTRRTKAEIAEDEAAEAAEAAEQAAAVKGGVASTFAKEVEQAAAPATEPDEPKPEFAAKRRFFYDFKKEEFLLIEIGEEIPPLDMMFEGDKRFEELDEAAYRRGLKSQQDEASAKAAPAVEAPPSVDDVIAASDSVLKVVHKDGVHKAAERVGDILIKIGGSRKVGDVEPAKRAAVIKALRALAEELKGSK